MGLRRRIVRYLTMRVTRHTHRRILTGNKRGRGLGELASEDFISQRNYPLIRRGGQGGQSFASSAESRGTVVRENDGKEKSLWGLRVRLAFLRRRRGRRRRHGDNDRRICCRVLQFFFNSRHGPSRGSLTENRTSSGSDMASPNTERGARLGNGGLKGEEGKSQRRTSDNKKNEETL